MLLNLPTGSPIPQRIGTYAEILRSLLDGHVLIELWHFHGLQVRSPLLSHCKPYQGLRASNSERLHFFAHS